MNEEKKRRRGPGKSDDWYCRDCDEGFGSQDCEEMAGENIVACPNCKKGLIDASLFERPTKDDRNEDGSIKPDSGLDELISEVAKMKREFDEEHGELIDADKFEFPLTVKKILAQGLFIGKPRPDVGAVVRVRPVGDEKTYAGILLGDLIVGVEMYKSMKSEALFVNGMRNPAIFIPALKRVVWGRGSWWAPVQDEADLERLITDEDIADIWYVKLLHQLMGVETKDGKVEMDVGFVCPKCGAEHSRGALDPLSKIYRCLKCGYVGPKIDDEWVPCPECDGSKFGKETPVPLPCTRCGGKGKVSLSGITALEVNCSECKGTGKVIVEDEKEKALLDLAKKTAETPLNVTAFADGEFPFKTKSGVKDDFVACPKCEGTGVLSVPPDSSAPCPRCSGTGKMKGLTER